jgi:ABC-type phosphate transport system ATPase subunit
MSTLKNGILAFKTLLSPFGTGKKTFFSTLNIMILQTVRNECVRFGGHVDIEISYKILWLDVLKETLILHNLSCFH